MSENRAFANGPDANTMDLGFGPDPQPQQPDNSEPASGGQVTLSQEQFDALLRQIGQSKQELDYTAAITSETPQALPEIDLSQLPDPRVDFDGFRTQLQAGLQQARQQVLDVAQTQVHQVTQNRSTLDDAWALLQERYPEVSKYEGEISMAAQREMDELRSRGIDPIQVLSNNMDMAVDRIAARAQASLDRARGFQEGADDTEYGRTEMIQGGNPRPQKRSAREEQPSNMIDDLKKMQRELGIY